MHSKKKIIGVLQSYIKHFFSKEFLTFIFVGIINTFNGTLLSYLYSLFFNPNISFVLGYITSLAVNYVLNSKITFKESLSVDKFVKFSISYIPNFLIQNSMVFIVFNIMRLPKLIAYIFAAVFAVPITFIILKLFAFRKSDDKK